MPVEVLRRRFAAPLWLRTFSCRSGPTCDKLPAFYTQGVILPLLLPLRTREARRKSPGWLCRAFFFLIRRRKAPRKIPVQPDTAFPYACAQHGGKSPLADTPFPADGNAACPLACARPRSRAVPAGRLPDLCRPSPQALSAGAPGLRPAIKKKGRCGSSEPQQAGRPDASCSLYCPGIAVSLSFKPHLS